MSIIKYKFADGHTEEIEVTEEVAATFDAFNKYEKKIERKETRRHISLDMLREKGIDFPDPNADIDVVLERQESERRELAELERKKLLLAKKKKS